MQYLECGKYRIPLAYVKSIAWTRKARTVEQTGGYSVFQGYEGTEVSLQVVYDHAIAYACGLDAVADRAMIQSIVTDRMEEPDTLYMGGYPICPQLKFALTSCNKTYVHDAVYDPVISLDLAFSGVRVSKEASRNRAMSFDEDEAQAGMLPEVTLEVNGKSLKLQDMHRIQRFTRTQDSMTVVCEISDDLAIADHDGFMSKLVEDKATLKVELPEGDVKYWVVANTLNDNEMTLTASILPPACVKTSVWTWWDVSLSDLLKELCARMGVDCNVKFRDYKVAYYQNVGTPMDGIKAIVGSAGLIMSWRGNVLTFADVPEKLWPNDELEAQTTPSDDGASKLDGLVWEDGVNRFTVGDTDGETVQVHSVFRCEDKRPCEMCLNHARYMQRAVVVQAPINVRLVHHSPVWVNSNGKRVQGLVESFELDYVGWTASYEVHLC